MRRAFLFVAAIVFLSIFSYAEETNGREVLEAYLNLPEKPSEAQEQQFFELMLSSSRIDGEALDISRNLFSDPCACIDLPGFDSKRYSELIWDTPHDPNLKEKNYPRPPQKAFMFRCLLIPLLMENFKSEKTDIRWKYLAAGITISRGLYALADYTEQNPFIYENGDYIRQHIDKYTRKYGVEKIYQMRINNLIDSLEITGDSYEQKLRIWTEITDKTSDIFMLQALLQWLWRNTKSEHVFAKPVPQGVSIDPDRRHLKLAKEYISKDFVKNPDEVWEEYYGLNTFVLKRELPNSIRMKVFVAFYLMRESILGGKEHAYLRREVAEIVYGTPFREEAHVLLTSPEIYQHISPIYDESRRNNIETNRRALKGSYKLKLNEEGTLPDVWLRGNRAVDNSKGKLKIDRDFVYPATLVYTSSGEIGRSLRSSIVRNKGTLEGLLANTDFFEWDRQNYKCFEFAVKQDFKIDKYVNYDYSRDYLTSLLRGKWKDRTFYGLLNGLEMLIPASFTPDNVFEKFSPCLYYHYKHAKYSLYTACNYNAEYDFIWADRPIALLAISPAEGELPDEVFAGLVYSKVDNWLYNTGVIPSSIKPWNVGEIAAKVDKYPELAIIEETLERIERRSKVDFYKGLAKLDKLKNELSGIPVVDRMKKPDNSRKRYLGEARKHLEQITELYTKLNDHPTDEEAEAFYLKLKDLTGDFFQEELFFNDNHDLKSLRSLFTSMTGPTTLTSKIHFDIKVSYHATDIAVPRKKNVLLSLLARIAIEDFKKQDLKETSPSKRRGALFSTLALCRMFAYKPSDINSEYQHENYMWLDGKLKELEKSSGLLDTYNAMIQEELSKLNLGGDTLEEKLKTWRANLDSGRLSPSAFAAHLEWLVENVSTDFIFPKGIPEQVDSSLLYSYYDICMEYINPEYLIDSDFDQKDKRKFDTKASGYPLAFYALTMLEKVIANGDDVPLRRKFFLHHMLDPGNPTTQRVFLFASGKYRKAVVPAIERITSDFGCYRKKCLNSEIIPKKVYEADTGRHSFFINGSFTEQKGHVSFSAAHVMPITYSVNAKNRLFDSSNIIKLLDVLGTAEYLEVIPKSAKPRMPLPLRKVNLSAEFDYDFTYENIRKLYRENKLEETYPGISENDMKRFESEYRKFQTSSKFGKEYAPAFMVSYPKSKLTVIEVSEGFPMYGISGEKLPAVAVSLAPDLDSEPQDIKPVFVKTNQLPYYWWYAMKKPSNIEAFEKSDDLKVMLAELDEYFEKYDTEMWDLRRASFDARVKFNIKNWGDSSGKLFNPNIRKHVE